MGRDDVLVLPTGTTREIATVNDGLLRLAVIAISFITIVSGLAQMIAPAFVLEIVGAETSPPAQHLFRTLGMFMAITGGLFLQSLLGHSQERSIPFWIGVQKLAAAALVSWGVYSGIFGTLALGVAGFDLLSGILAWVFMSRIGK